MSKEDERFKHTGPLEVYNGAMTKYCLKRQHFPCTPEHGEVRAQTWSNYKLHNTVKFLIGIMPCSVISYLSSAWGGRQTNKNITIESDFLGKLLPENTVIAD